MKHLNMRARIWWARLAIILCSGMILASLALAEEPMQPIPFVKQADWGTETVQIRTTQINFDPSTLQQEAKNLLDAFEDFQIAEIDRGVPVSLEIAPDRFPLIDSRYRTRIMEQGYRISVNKDGIQIVAAAPAGVFYGIQTLTQLIEPDATIREVEIVDWPDLPIRMIMIDPARQNENMDYYRRVIRFCGRYKINRILCHLTDDQTVCLAHEDYPELLHPQAWTQQQVEALVNYAKRYHIELIPEIESFGHSGLFVQREDFKEILHETDGPRTATWMGTDVPGFTNVLCPAKEKAYQFLNRMYKRSSESFPSPVLHIGCDEVDMTHCASCEKKFPGISKSEWFLGHLLRCRELAETQGKQIGLWGDMLLSHPEIAKGLPVENTIIFDWHYGPEVDPKSVEFFDDLGFEVIASPALMCWPHIIMPDAHNHENIRRFAEIAREKDLLGVNTTIWIPFRYMSDVLWPGIAHASTQAWSGSNANEKQFYVRFLKDYFGSNEGDTYYQTWKELLDLVLHSKEFAINCWTDETTLKKTQAWLVENQSIALENQKRVKAVQDRLSRIGQSVTQNKIEWQTMERSVGLLAYTYEHLLAAPQVQADGKWNRDLVKQLDKDCSRCIGWILEDWDRNRYQDDPNKKGIYLPGHHMLNWFDRMHQFHHDILEGKAME